MLTFDEPTHTYRWFGARVPGVTDVIRAALGDPFAGVPSHVLERKRLIGSAAHKACELDSQGRLDEATVHPAVLPYLEAWRAFVRESGFKIFATESLFYSEKYGYAGRPDFVGLLPNESWAIGDLKTGLPGPQAAMQTAAYSSLVDGAFFAPNDPLVRRFALRALPTGRYKMEQYTNPGDFADFLACLRVFRIREKLNAK